MKKSRLRICECGYDMTGLPQGMAGTIRCPECGEISLGRAPALQRHRSVICIICVVFPVAILLIHAMLQTPDSFGFPSGSRIDAIVIGTMLITHLFGWIMYYSPERQILRIFCMAAMTAVLSTVAGVAFVFIVCVARIAARILQIL